MASSSEKLMGGGLHQPPPLTGRGLIDICASPRTNTDAVLDLFGIGKTPRRNGFVAVLNYNIILIKLRYLDLVLMQEKQV